MKQSRVIRSRYGKNKHEMRLITSLVLLIVGLLMSIPFVVDTFFLQHEYHYIEFWPMMFLLGLIVGLPMFMGGIIGLFIRNELCGSSSTAEIDLGRIRYVVENGGKK